MGKAQNLKTSEADERLLALSLELFATFYSKYYYLETILKDRLYHLIKRKFGEDWFQQQLGSTDSETVFKVEAETILRRKPKDFVLKDKGLLVESGLGLWIELFNRTYYKELKGSPISIFPKLPAKVKRKDLYQKLTRAKDLRNQLYHYRIPPLTKSTGSETLKKLLEVNDDLINLLQWLGVSSKQINSKDLKKHIAAIRKLLSN